MVTTKKYLTPLVLVMSFFSANQLHAKALTDLISDQICEKKIVILGELPSHGESLAFQTKAQLAQKLIEQCGFDTLYFEAPVYDFYGFRYKSTKDQAKPIDLDRAIGGFWLNNELTSWRMWLYNQSIQGKLFIGGLDDQISRTSEFARTHLPNWVEEAIDNPLDDSCKQDIERNLYWQYNDQYPFDDKAKAKLIQCTSDATSTPLTLKAHPKSEQKLLLNLENYFNRQFNQAAKDRDEIMFWNLKWQNSTLPNTHKVIIWTSTVHASRMQGPIKNKPLGKWVADQWHKDVAVIGFTAYSGHSSMAGLPIQKISKAEVNTLEAKAISSGQDWNYLNQQELADLGVISSRLLGEFNTLNWSEYFDGVVVFKKEQAPTFKNK